MPPAPEIDAHILILQTQLKDLLVVFQTNGFSKEVALRASQIRATVYGRNIVELLRGMRWRQELRPDGSPKYAEADPDPDDAELAAIVAGADALLLILSHVFYDPITESGDPELMIRGSQTGNPGSSNAGSACRHHRRSRSNPGSKITLGPIRWRSHS
jgi:hypothetical protein